MSKFSCNNDRVCMYPFLNGLKRVLYLSRKSHRFKHYRRFLAFVDDWGFKARATEAQFTFSHSWKLWKNGFRVIKPINQGLFALALRTLQQFSPSRVWSGEKISSLSIEIACIQKYINWWARENPLKIQFYYRLGSFFMHGMGLCES